MDCLQAYSGFDRDNPKQENNSNMLRHTKYNPFVLVVVACWSLGFLCIEKLIVDTAIAESDGAGITALRLSNTMVQHYGNTTVTETEADNITYTPSSFWGSLDLEGEINCGEYKCLFRPKKTSLHDRELGTNEYAYLVGSNFKGYQFEAEIKMAWHLAQYLKSTFNAKHLFLGPPGKVMVSHSALQFFQNQTWTRKPRGPSEPIYQGGQFATVQKVRLAPQPWVRIDMYRNKWTTFKYFYRENVVNRTRFINTLKNDVESALDILEAVPLLANDFQIMIDGEGSIYQFDLDRAFVDGAYKRGHFRRSIAKSLFKSTELLDDMRVWASSKRHRHQESHEILKRGESQDWEAVVMDYLSDSSSLSCKALDEVENMSGKIGDERNKTREANLMMVHLVQRVMFNQGAQKYDGLWNCSL